MRIIGISAFYHDSAAALVENGVVVAAAQEERFTRVKHDASFPGHALDYCFSRGNWQAEDFDAIVFYEDPELKAERLFQTFSQFAPHGYGGFRRGFSSWAGERVHQSDQIVAELQNRIPDVDWLSKILCTEHHISHAASAFYPSPFEESTILTMDGVGEWATTSVAVGRGSEIDLLREIKFPHSLGLLYSAFTYYTGFKVNSGEYKLMGLAPYGVPKYAQKILDNLVDKRRDGSFRLNMDYFDYCQGGTMLSEKFETLFGQQTRAPESPLTQFHMDIAASIQAALEEVVLSLVQGACALTGVSNLCLAGGVALNCVANGKIIQDNLVDRLWVQPAAGDAGGAIGAALWAYYAMSGAARVVDPQDGMNGSYLGPEFMTDEIGGALSDLGAVFQKLDENELIQRVAEALSKGQVVGWFQGRMEFGPRALGNRSILGNPMDTTTQRNLNLKIKYRESFRPFAPSILRERVSDYFELQEESPYMLLVAPVNRSRRREMTEREALLFGIEQLNVPRSDIPAVTHIDYSARIQTVSSETNSRYYKLIEAFCNRTGCPVVVNTSFNIRGEPIVHSPEDAFRCFMGTEMDVLAAGDFILLKDEQDPMLKRDYRAEFSLD